MYQFCNEMKKELITFLNFLQTPNLEFTRFVRPLRG